MMGVHKNAKNGQKRYETGKPQDSIMDANIWHWRDLWSPEWVALLVIGIGLIIVPYFRGLYFDTNMMVVEQVLCLLLLVAGIWKWIVSSKEKKAGPTNGNGQSAPWYNPRHLFIFALLIPYVIGLWTAVSPYDNWMQLFRYVAYGIAFFLAAEALSRKPSAADFLQVCIQISIGWTALFAVAAALGQVTYKDAVLNGRLASVFQYPNTFGIILAVGIVGGLLLTLRRQWWLQSIGGLFLIPMGYVFLLTLSRGAWLVFPVVYLIGMLLLPLRAQWAYLIHSVPLAAGTGILLFSLGTQLDGASAGVVWTEMILVMAAGMIGYPFMVRYLTHRFLLILQNEDSEALVQSNSNTGYKSNRWRNLAVQLVIPVVIAGLLASGLFVVLNSPAVQGMLPDTIQSRLSEINFETHSVIERGYFNQDAWEIYKEYPIVGAGGGGWRALFQKYQDYPYWSTQSHNFFSQLIVETGTIGILLFAGIFLYYIWRGLRRYIYLDRTELRLSRSFFLVVLFGLLGHSAIDFNMSYGYVGFLLFLALAGWQAATGNKSMVETSVSTTGSFKLLRSFPVSARFVQAATSIILLFIAGTMFFPIHNYSRAEVMYKNAGQLLDAGEVNEALNNLERAIQRNPYHPGYHLTYGSVLISLGLQQQDQQILQKGVDHVHQATKVASTHPQRLTQAAQSLMRAGETEEAFTLIQQALNHGSWDIELYPIYMEIAYEVGEERLNNGENKTATDAWKAGLQAYERIEPMRASLNNLPETLYKGRAFAETEEMKLLAGKLSYRLGQYQEAFDRLSSLYESKNEDIRRQAMLWSIAAQLKTGVSLEQTMGYDQFVQNPDWGDELRYILMLDIVEGT